MSSKTMEAVYFTGYGGPETLTYGEIECPSIGPTEVLISVEACALNRLDIDVREGNYGTDHDFPHVTGGDIAGTVVQAGKLVSAVDPGDRVVVDPLITCGECHFCQDSKSNHCIDDQSGTIGISRWGGLAEFVSVPERNVFSVPDHIDTETAAAMPISYATGWHMLDGRAGLRLDETVLVFGASGGLGSAGVQIADYMGATVLAATSSESKMERARSLGADHALNYESEQVVEAVRGRTGGTEVDVVFDHVGAATWEQGLRSLAQGGRLVVAGSTTGHEVTADLRTLISHEITVLGSSGWTKDEFARLADLVWHGELQPEIQRTVSLADARSGIELLESRDISGKIVVTQ